MHWDEQMISTLLDQLFSGYAGSMPGVSAMLLHSTANLGNLWVTLGGGCGRTLADRGGHEIQ